MIEKIRTSEIEQRANIFKNGQHSLALAILLSSAHLNMGDSANIVIQFLQFAKTYTPEQLGNLILSKIGDVIKDDASISRFIDDMELLYKKINYDTNKQSKSLINSVAS